VIGRVKTDSREASWEGSQTRLDKISHRSLWLGYTNAMRRSNFDKSLAQMVDWAGGSQLDTIKPLE
jgi:hypothetical protein